MKFIIGLGNPGISYKNNRHNVGHMFCDYLNKQKNKKVVVLKTDTFMNDSGDFILKQKNNRKIDLNNLYIVHDDLDIKLGEYKIQFGKGPKVHNGLNDAYEKLGTNEFWHVRVGVENRESDNRIQGKDYVLSDFTLDEQLILDKVIKEICKELEK